MARKVSDKYTIPLCRTHHRASHRAGDARAWWRQLGIDPIKIAGDLWKETRGIRFAGSPAGSDASDGTREQIGPARHQPSLHSDAAAGRTS
jgi:hypothetical protein